MKKQFKVFISFLQNGKINKSSKKNEKRNQTAKKNKEKKNGQDLHPDWDRFRGTMLYPLSCGELAMKGEQMLRSYVTSGVRTARNK